MKLSILLITHNQQNYIKECIYSILMQKMTFDYEVIIADDFSTDNTLKIIESSLKGTECNYQILNSSANIGITKNFQRGFSACNGEYISVMEGDDYWTDPFRLQKHIDFLDRHRECVMSYNRIIDFCENDASFNVIDWKSSSDFEYITSARLAQGNCIGNFSACVFRNSALQKLAPEIFEISFSDWILGMAIGQFGLIANLKDAMSVYRNHSNGKWSGMSLPDKKRNTLQQIEEYNQYFSFKYNEEFTGLKNWILSTGKKRTISKTIILEYIPPIFLLIFRLIIPAKILNLLKKLL